jgi:LAO/AO transport system kinase
VAVLAVDPSSVKTKGSILGDKTRMERLSRKEEAFIRPSPTGGTLGGVARKTREAILVFEAAGYDVILVETVGVGQSEVMVRSMVDFFLLLLIAGAGDELQGIKRGIMELADAVLVNKADGDSKEAALAARADYARALHYLEPATQGWRTEAFTCSALEEEGIQELWQVVQAFRTLTHKSGIFQARRQEQALAWLHEMLKERLHEIFYLHPKVLNLLPEVEKGVLDGSIPVTQAAWRILASFEEP